MSLTLESSSAKVGIHSFGAELNSFYNKSTGTEHVWQADPNVWKRHAPILFPIVGQVQNGQYLIDGETYHMGQHGIARDNEFSVLSQSENRVDLVLRSSDETKLKYPFDFELQISYQLEDSVLVKTCKVLNSGKVKLPFSIGEHPGFVCPFDGGSFSDYVLEFDQDELADRVLLDEGGLRSGEKQKEEFIGNTIELSPSVFDQDALVYENLNSQHITLRKKGGDHGVRVGFEGYRWMGIWSKPGANAPFVCIEPWLGITAQRDEPMPFEEKDGMMILDPGETFTCSMSIELV